MCLFSRKYYQYGVLMESCDSSNFLIKTNLCVCVTICFVFHQHHPPTRLWYQDTRKKVKIMFFFFTNKYQVWNRFTLWLKNFWFDFQFENNRSGHVIDWMYGNLLNKVKKIRATHKTPIRFQWRNLLLLFLFFHTTSNEIYKFVFVFVGVGLNLKQIILLSNRYVSTLSTNELAHIFLSHTFFVVFWRLFVIHFEFLFSSPSSFLNRKSSRAVNKQSTN